MVEHWSEKPGVDSSILSLGILFRPNLPHFVVVQALEYLGATAPLRTVYFALSLLELCQISLKKSACAERSDTSALRASSYSIPRILTPRIKRFSFEKAFLVRASSYAKFV